MKLPGLTRSTGSAVADVERAIVGLTIALRSCVLVTVAVAVPDAVAAASNLRLYAAATAVTVVFSGAMFLAWLRRRSAASVRWGGVDLAVAALALVLVSASFPASQQVGTWEVWAPGYALSAAMTTGAWARIRWAFLGSAALGGCYLAVMAVRSDAHMWSLLANALNYPLVALASAWMATVLRRFARQADEGREAAARAAAELENERYRLLVHDTTGILRQLADNDLPDRTREVLQEQALVESARLRSYVERGPREPAGGPCRLGDLVCDALDGFRDLPVETALMLGGRAALSAPTAQVLLPALVTVLHNVRCHARAREVVIHADARDGRWELTVRDDGVGFDPASQPFGFGLSTQVFAQASTAGIEVDLSSEPGQGTVVVFAGPEDPTPDRAPREPQDRRSTEVTR